MIFALCADDPSRIPFRERVEWGGRSLSARVLDDRSLNGVFRNGSRVDLEQLRDGDEIAVGRFRLYFLKVAVERSAADVASAVG